MKEPLDHTFIKEINLHIGIAHKVCNIYFLGSEEREDVLQEMLYQLWKSFPHFQKNAKFSTWMYRVCLNTALTYLMKNKKNQSEALSPRHLLIPDPEDSQDEKTRMLYRSIESLSQLNKAIILLYLEDLRYEEIAEVTGLSKSNVSVRLVRIKKELEKKLTQSFNATKDGKY